MSQKHPIVKTKQPLILKVEGKSLSNLEGVRKVIESIKKLNPAVVVIGSYENNIERLQKVADLFFNEHPEDAWHLFEDFRRSCFEFARKLGVSSKVQHFLTEMKKSVEMECDVHTFSSDERHKEEFTNFLLCLSEQFAVKVIFHYLLKKTAKDSHGNFLQVDAKKLIVFGKDQEKKPVLSHSESVENFFQLLKKNPDKIIFVTGAVAQDNRYLGPDGISVTVALVQSSYEKNGIEPVLIQPQIHVETLGEVLT
jgi:hypothetical protein